MKLSTRGRYGMRAMLDLALHAEEGALLLKDVAHRQDVSVKYLEQLITPLRAAGLVRGVRGAHGGYTLARPPEEISVSQILMALEGSLAPVECLGETKNCQQKSYCATQELWCEIYAAIQSVLEKRTLKDLADRQRLLNRKVFEGLSYVI